MFGLLDWWRTPQQPARPLVKVHRHTIKRLPGETDEQIRLRCLKMVCALNDKRYGLAPDTALRGEGKR